MKNSEIDYIILGGGCSALSFALELTKNKVYRRSFLIIESKTKYVDDRSWCFWQNQENSNKALITKSWKKFSVSFKGQTVFHRSDEYHYNYIRSIDYYKYAKKEIKKSPNIKLIMGEKALKVKKIKHKYLVQTNKNNYVTRNILDTRPKKNIFKKTPFLYQSFLGYEISAVNENYNKKIVAIMENMRYENNNFMFDYILPIKNNTFLVEVTTFSRSKVAVKKLKSSLQKSITRNKFVNYKILRKEYGVIPMGFVKKNSFSSNYFYAGTAAGAVRASSGYAFLRIQEWAKTAVKNLKKNGKILSHPEESFTIRVMDSFFLKTLEKNISSAPFIFYIFLKRIKTKSFIRFMIGSATLTDYLRVIISMPKKYFLNIKL